jgi:hypothetical protein
MEKETEVLNWKQDFFVHHRILSAVKRVGLVSERMLCIVLRGHWCNITVSNVHALHEVKSGLGISLHQDSNDNGVRIVNFTTSKNLVVKSTMFPRGNIHKYTWTPPDGKTYNQTDHRNGIRVYLMYDLSWEVIAILFTVWWLQKLGIYKQ